MASDRGSWCPTTGYRVARFSYQGGQGFRSCSLSLSHSSFDSSFLNCSISAKRQSFGESALSAHLHLSGLAVYGPLVHNFPLAYEEL